MKRFGALGVEWESDIEAGLITCERSNYRSGATSAFGKRTMRWALKIVAQIYDGRLTTIWGGVALNAKTNECIYVYRTRGPNTTHPLKANVARREQRGAPDVGAGVPW